MTDVFDPKSWPKKYRRIFVLTMPISGPLWLIVFSVAIIGMILALCVLYPIQGLIKIWEGDECNRD